MANNKAAISFDQLLQESRKKRHVEKLAQDILGKNRRTSTPASPRPTLSASASLASRVGIAKRTSSLVRSNSTSARNARPSPRPNRSEKEVPKSFFTDLSSDPAIATKSGGRLGSAAQVANGGPEISIRGAAGGPHVVVASNFAEGTTAADIESVMLEVGGPMTACRLVVAHPTVIAEMTFVEKAGAEAVIGMFNNKKADGRTLHVYMKSSASGTRRDAPLHREIIQAEIEPPMDPPEDTMDVDENAASREAENRLREERRGGARPERAPPRESFPPPQRGNGRGYEDDYYRGPPRRPEPNYQDGRYSYGGGEPRYGGGRGGRYRDEGRLYSDGMRRGGQGWQG